MASIRRGLQGVLQKYTSREVSPGVHQLFNEKNTALSFVHDIPHLAASNEVHMVVEIPKGAQEKMEVEMTGNHCIVQDVTAENQKRFLKYMGGVPYHYGSIPQTYEDPGEYMVYKGESFKGDGDPVDIIDFSTLPVAIGDIRPVKVLASLGLIDEGEIDWKVIGISSMDPSADRYESYLDIPPKIIATIVDWYENYKTLEGKGKNRFLDHGRLFDAQETLQMIDLNHKSYKKWGAHKEYQL